MAMSMFRVTKGIELDNIQMLEGAGIPGASGDSSLAPVGSLYLDNTNGELFTKVAVGVGTNKWSVMATESYVNTEISTVTNLVTSLGNAFNYIGVLTSGGATSGTAFDLDTLAAGSKDSGDYYKVTVPGWFVVGAGTPFFANIGDGLVWNTSGDVDKIDNTNSEVQGTTDFITVTGNSDTGFVVDIAAGFKTRVDNAEIAITTLQTDVTTLQTNGGNLQTEVDNIETSLGGAVNTSGVFQSAAFTTFDTVTSPTSITDVLSQIDSSIGPDVVSNTIINAADSVTTNLQNITTYIENSSLVVTGTATQSVTDTVTGVMAKWLVHVKQTATPANMSAFEIFAATNGAGVDSNKFGILKTGVSIAGLATDVTLSGSDLVLAVTSTVNMEVTIKRVAVA